MESRKAVRRPYDLIKIEGDKSMVEQELGKDSFASPDSSWRGLYLAGGVSVILYVLLAIVAPAVLFWIAHYDTSMDAETTLRFISQNRTWWMVEQTLTLGPSIISIVVFLALFVSLKNVNKSFALIGSGIAIVCQILFVAYYPVLIGLTYLSDQYMKVVSEAQRAVLVSAAEGLLAQNNAFNPLYEGVFAVSILILSLVMLKGVFPKATAIMGIATSAAAVTALSLQSILGIGYFWWWFFFLIWFVLVGWKLFRMARN
jgi:hypothetical protein